MPKIIDVCTFNGEHDLFDMRYNYLKDYVDEFIVCEAPKTFTGHDKPLYFKKEKYPDVKYFVIDENDDELWEMARNSPNTKGADHWLREFVHKESIKKALTHLKDDDIVFIGDVDELWQPEALRFMGVVKLKLEVRPFFLNNLSDEQFWGTIVGHYKDIKNECLNHLRTTAQKTIGIYGYHFTSQGGIDEVRRKLNDSYTQESYNTQEVQDKLEERFGKSDYIGRSFAFKEDNNLPELFLTYKHLLK